MEVKLLVFCVLLQTIGFVHMASIDMSMYTYRIIGEPNPEDGEALDKFNPETDERNANELGSYLEGDLLMPIVSLRNGLIKTSARWANATVPFIVNGTFTSTQWGYIDQAMQIIQNKTCVKFKHRTSEVDFLSIDTATTGCWSAIGRTGGRQICNLQTPGCVTKVSTPLHELVHVLGFFHQHNDPERDSYVYINYTNINPSAAGNFKKQTNTSVTSFGVTYDYDSIMHYSAYAYSNNGQPTIVPLVPAPQIGKATTLSSKDILKIKRMYNCPGA